MWEGGGVKEEILNDRPFHAISTSSGMLETIICYGKEETGEKWSGKERGCSLERFGVKWFCHRNGM